MGGFIVVAQIRMLTVIRLIGFVRVLALLIESLAAE